MSRNRFPAGVVKNLPMTPYMLKQLFKSIFMFKLIRIDDSLIARLATDMLSLFRHNVKSFIAQEERLATSP